jgi:hypothetical protein
MIGRRMMVGRRRRRSQIVSSCSLINDIEVDVRRANMGDRAVPTEGSHPRFGFVLDFIVWWVIFPFWYSSIYSISELLLTSYIKEEGEFFSLSGGCLVEEYDSNEST